MTEAEEKIIWRVPQVLTAALFVIAAALSAVALYISLAGWIRIAIGVIAALFAGAGVFAARQLLYADSEELYLRRVLGQKSFAWSQISSIDVVQKGKTGMTLALDLGDGPMVLIPPSLVLPAKPHSLTSTRTLLRDKARQLSSIGGLDQR